MLYMVHRKLSSCPCIRRISRVGLYEDLSGSVQSRLDVDDCKSPVLLRMKGVLVLLNGK